MPEEKKTFNQRTYIDQWQEEHYDRLYIRIPKGEKDRLKAYASQVGESLNVFIQRAISDRICTLHEEGKIKGADR